MPIKFETSPVVDQVTMRSAIVENLTDYYAKESFNTNFYKWILVVADSMVDIYNEKEATILDAGVDEARTPALFPNFGYWFLRTDRRSDLNWGWDDYRYFLKVLGEAWTQYGTTKFGLRRVTQVATGLSPLILEHFRYAPWTLGKDAIGVGGFVQTGKHVWNSKAKESFVPLDIKSVWASKQTDVWIVGSPGKIFRSQDGGTTWTHIDPGLVSTFFGVSGVGPYNVWVVGSGGIICHYNELATIPWTIHGVTAETWKDIWMLNLNYGWAVGTMGTAYQWNGHDWIDHHVPSVNTMNAVDGYEWSSVYVVGGGGAVFYWHGAGWNNVSVGVPVMLRGVAVVNGTTLWVCGDGGFVAKSTNSGTTWTVVPVPTLVQLNDIAVSSDGTQIRVVGKQDTILYSSDSGTTWVGESTQSVDQHFNRIHMRPNFTMGYVCGDFEILLCRNGQAPGYTLYNGIHLDNMTFVNRALLESRRGRRNSVDIVVWNVQDPTLLWNYLQEMKAAHIKIYVLLEIPFIMDYYYEYDTDFWLSVNDYGILGAVMGYDKGLVVNGRPYGTSTYMSRIVVGQEDLLVPQLS